MYPYTDRVVSWSCSFDTLLWPTHKHHSQRLAMIDEISTVMIYPLPF